MPFLSKQGFYSPAPYFISKEGVTMYACYPAIFYPAVEGGYTVVFPDLEGCITQGETLDESMAMAEDALGTWLYEYYIQNRTYPKATLRERIIIKPLDGTQTENSFINLVGIDMQQYLRQLDVKTVKRTVSLPSYLNEMAKARGINCSQLLQDALKETLLI